MTIWIDNDGCPKVVRELVLQAAMRTSTQLVVVGNSYIKLPESSFVKMICVPKGFDEADHYIAEHASSGDLVITSDVPLAGRVVAKGCTAISAHGHIFDEASIGEKLAFRNLMQELRSGGLVHGGSSNFGPSDKKRFADTFDRLLMKYVKSK